jgi:hypothetical protein
MLADVPGPTGGVKGQVEREAHSRGVPMKSLSLTGRILAVAIAATFAFAGTAFAASWTATTSLSLHADDHSVDKGDKVDFSGNLKSERKKCRSRQRVSLFKGNKKVATTRTSRRGHYEFTQTIRRTKTWHTEYKGRTFGTHPNIKHCDGSRSNDERVEVH